MRGSNKGVEELDKSKILERRDPVLPEATVPELDQRGWGKSWRISVKVLGYPGNVKHGYLPNSRQTLHTCPNIIDLFLFWSCLINTYS